MSDEPASGGRQPSEERVAPPPPGRTIGVWEYLILFQIVAATWMLGMRCVVNPWVVGSPGFDRTDVAAALRESWEMTFGMNCWGVPLMWLSLKDSEKLRFGWFGDPPWKWAAIVAGALTLFWICYGVLWAVFLNLVLGR